MDSFTVSPLLLVVLVLIGVALLALAWKKGHAKVEEETIDTLHTVAAGAVAGMEKLLAAKRSTVAQLQAELDADSARVTAAKQALSAQLTPPAA